MYLSVRILNASANDASQIREKIAQMFIEAGASDVDYEKGATTTGGSTVIQIFGYRPGSGQFDIQSLQNKIEKKTGIKTHVLS